MILFVFEGADMEPRIFEAIRKVFLPKEIEPFVCTYNSNIYSLYNKLKEYDNDFFSASGDTVTVLKDILLQNNDLTLQGKTVSDFSEIYMFFDYEIQENSLCIEEKNKRLNELIEYFDNETENGKLYVNYPMVESFRYTKQLPDGNFWSYTVKVQDCAYFKNLASEFSFYKSYDYILLPSDNKSEDDKQKIMQKVINNWKFTNKQNIEKANYICNGINDFPADISDITQSEILKCQIEKYVELKEPHVAVLNAFPLFLYEYLGQQYTP